VEGGGSGNTKQNKKKQKQKQKQKQKKKKNTNKNKNKKVRENSLLRSNKLAEVLKYLNVFLRLAASEVLVDKVGKPLVHAQWFQVCNQLTLQVFAPVTDLHWYTVLC
jgi:hypothetical protein